MRRFPSCPWLWTKFASSMLSWDCGRVSEICSFCVWKLYSRWKTPSRLRICSTIRVNASHFDCFRGSGPLGRHPSRSPPKKVEELSYLYTSFLCLADWYNSDQKAFGILFELATRLEALCQRPVTSSRPYFLFSSNGKGIKATVDKPNEKKG
jgi:hypothetical protein